MRRILKSSHGVLLNGAGIISEDNSFDLIFNSNEWELIGTDNGYGIYTKNCMPYEYTLKVRETEKSFLYELTKKEIEVMDSNIFELEKKVISSEEFRANNEAFIEFETKNEKGFGFVKNGVVTIPVKEVFEGIEVIELSEEKFMQYDQLDVNRINLSSYNKIFKFNRAGDLKFKKKQNISLGSFNGNEEVVLFDEIDSAHIFGESLIVVQGDKKTLYSKIVGKNINFICKSDVEEIPGEFRLTYKKYIPSKTTTGITDLKANPFAWLSY